MQLLSGGHDPKAGLCSLASSSVSSVFAEANNSSYETPYRLRLAAMTSILAGDCKCEDWERQQAPGNLLTTWLILGCSM
ncbi:MAG TPA: hypothetical protein VEL11_11560 [Candidatus Bathyarchaeia archaeon]|nr:hypothetical protein [Candidatus Bathyarchaeia archaeon]